MKVVILSGLPGSGKSTYARALKGPVVACSADHWFERSGSYCFKPSELGKAHGQCLIRYLGEIQTYLRGEIACEHTLVVDNTNTTNTEIAPYVALAQAYGIPYEIVMFRCDPELSARRNTHGVPLKSCQQMARRLENLVQHFPPHWEQPRIIDSVE